MNSGRKKKIFTITILFTIIGLYVVIGGYLIWTASAHSRFEAAGRKTISLAVPAGLKTREIYRRKVREFEISHPGTSVRLLEISGNYYQKILVMIAGNVAPDLMWMGQSFSEFADRDVFLDITERIAKCGIRLDEFRPEVLALYRRGGRLYSLPFGVDTSFVAYNRKMFREAGLPYPEDDWSFDEFLRTAQVLTLYEKSGRVRRYGYRGGLPLEVFGASLFDRKTGAVTCDSAAMINYFQLNLDLNYKYHVCPTFEEQMNMENDNLGYFKQERVAMMLMYTMSWNRAFEILKDMDWGITMSPKVHCQAQWASSQAMCIYRDTKHPETVWELFRSFQDDDFMLAMSCRMIPARMPVVEKMFGQTVNRPANFKVLSKIMTVLRPTPRVPHLQELEAVFGRFAGRIFARLQSPETGMRECAVEMRRRIENFKINEQSDRK